MFNDDDALSLNTNAPVNQLKNNISWNCSIKNY